MTTAATPLTSKPSRRSFWIRQTIVWHWVSSAVCLGVMLLFTVTGITLNHAAQITSTPHIQRQSAQLPGVLIRALRQSSASGKQALPENLRVWLTDNFPRKNLAEYPEWSDTEIYISSPRPGGDSWISIDRESGKVTSEDTDRGWIAYLNDIHKGRHTGPAWQTFIDVVAGAFLIFTATGLILLQIHAPKRRLTWPAVAFGVAAPILLLMLFVHR